MTNICVYAASSDNIDKELFEQAHTLGILLAKQSYNLIYGGGAIGLMGAIAKGIHEAGGHVTGVIPRALQEREIAYEAADELILTDTMRERKAIMEDKGDAFIVLPGGFGTLEEAMEIIVLKQLNYIDKPLVFLNSNGIFDDLIHFFDTLIKKGFVPERCRNLYHISTTPEDVMDWLSTHHDK